MPVVRRWATAEDGSRRAASLGASTWSGRGPGLPAPRGAPGGPTRGPGPGVGGGRAPRRAGSRPSCWANASAWRSTSPRIVSRTAFLVSTMPRASEAPTARSTAPRIATKSRPRRERIRARPCSRSRGPSRRIPGAPSFPRSWATWTSTVRVPPANSPRQASSSRRSRLRTTARVSREAPRAGRTPERSARPLDRRARTVRAAGSSSTSPTASAPPSPTEAAPEVRRRIALTRATSSRGENGFVT